MGATFVDAKDTIFFSRDGSLDEQKTYNSLGLLRSGEGLFVVTGYYGAMPDGSIQTFDRGGSDITGALVSRAVSASVYENWTDVPGLLLADPGVVSGLQLVREATYEEVMELGRRGAKVLHPEAVPPVQEVGIPIHIRGLGAPDPGTWVSAHRKTADVVVGIASQVVGGGMVEVAIVGQGIAHRPDVRHRIADALGRAKVRDRRIREGTFSISLIVDVDKSRSLHVVRALYEEFAEG